jgi:monovalent cation:H+ antiporter, CPA1 family
MLLLSSEVTKVGQFEIYTFIICMTALLAYVNYRFVRLSPTIGIMALSLGFSLVLIGLQGFFPESYRSLTLVIGSIDFHTLLMKGMLGFLLFAGAIHIDAGNLKKERLPIIALASVSTLLSTGIVGTLLYYLFHAFGTDIALMYCLLFAALISPTDPIAVLSILKKAGLPKSLELKIAGESLFNDGVAVVIFVTLLSVAQTGADHLVLKDVVLLFGIQAGGGLLLGSLLGYASYRAVRSIDKYEVEVMISIATVMGGSLLAEQLGVSGPLAMVAAGIVFGNKGLETGVSDLSRDYLVKFWDLIDELLNASLFMLIGFEMLVIKYDNALLMVGGITVMLVLLARWVSVALPVLFIKRIIPFERHAVTILTWGGLRGGLSVALALSLPEAMHRDQFVAMTYMVVVFSILVQGLTIGGLYKKLHNRETGNSPAGK